MTPEEYFNENKFLVKNNTLEVVTADSVTEIIRLATEAGAKAGAWRYGEPREAGYYLATVNMGFVEKTDVFICYFHDVAGWRVDNGYKVIAWQPKPAPAAFVPATDGGTEAKDATRGG